MPVCDICSEELSCDSEWTEWTHLENEVVCPLCSLSGVTYDELNFHMNTAHSETGHTPSTDGSGHSETRAGSSCGSHSPGSHDGVKMQMFGYAGETSGSDGACEKLQEDQIMETLPSKHRHISSTSKGRTFSCPLCNLVYTDCLMLQEHVELHLQDQTASDGPVYVCPICEVVFDDSCSVQEHVELHLDCSPAGDVYGDVQFAQLLQEEDEYQRKEEEAKRDAQEFTQLQRQFGLDNSGGYRKQMERSMERAVSRGHMTPAEFQVKRLEMMETLAAGLDDGRTRTSGLLSVLYNVYQREIRPGARVWLCSESEHFSSSDGDRGWGCGYRNFQMLLSSLQRLEPYNTLQTLPDSFPSIPQVQALIEAAWAEGIDPQGASQFNRRLKGTRAWIGATEIYALLTSVQLRARIVDFHQPSGPSNTHPRLFQWVKNYFSLPSSTSARAPLRVVKTNLPPIYLQHQGHSRLIVGVEEAKNGSMCLLVFDPGCSPAAMKKLLSPNTSSAHFNHLRKFPAHLKYQQYQVVVVEGVLSKEEKQVVFDDSCSVQEHVELHLDCSPAGDVYGDVQFAQLLQEEDEYQRKEEEAKRDAQEFTQLQRQFGLDNSGGYRKQMERSMERAVSRGHMTPAEFQVKRLEMMETLAAGLDDGRTRTSGLLSVLYNVYQREIRPGARVWLCSESEHFSSSDGDRGWGCGYRNFQMLLSSLQRLEPYNTLQTLPDSFPSIPQVQALIEAAWAEGIDPQGASQFNRRLKGTRAWIGATEIYALLTSVQLRARIVDFHQPSGPSNTHPRLFQWVKNYFSLPSSTSARAPLRVVKTNLPPIYLQHQGHSRLIVGVEEAKNGSMCLLVFDPGCSPAAMKKLLSPNTSSAHFNHLRKFPAHLKYQQYQVVVVEGVLSKEEKQERIFNSRTFSAERIP